MSGVDIPSFEEAQERELPEISFADFYRLWETDGISEQYQITITDEMDETFRKLGGSINKIHTDEEYARTLGLKRKASFGLMYGVITVLMSELLVGSAAVGYNWDITFHKTPYIGDVLTIKGKISDIRKSIRSCVEEIVITNQDGEVAAKINVKIKMLK